MNEAIKRLIDGNLEYVNNINYIQIRQDSFKHGQNPYAVIISCSDSRVCPEFIFSTSIAELFVIRTAGLAIGDFELASVEFAISTFDIGVVVVLGHTYCGAVAATFKDKKQGHKLLKLTNEIKTRICGANDLEDAEKLNIIHACHQISINPIVKKYIEQGKIKVVPAIYDTEHGKVDFLYDYE